MRQKSIEVPGLSHHGAPIPTACRVGPILVTSRIMGKDPDTGQMPSDPESQAELCFANLKRVLKKYVEHAIGSRERPMSDDDLNSKFHVLADDILGEEHGERLLKLCWSIEGLKDAAEICRQSLPGKAQRRRA